MKSIEVGSIKAMEAMKSYLDESTVFDIKDVKGNMVCRVNIMPLFGSDMVLVSRLIKKVMIPLVEHGENIGKSIEHLDEDILGEIHDVLYTVMSLSIPKPVSMDEGEYNQVLKGYISINFVTLLEKVIEINLGPVLKVLEGVDVTSKLRKIEP